LDLATPTVYSPDGNAARYRTHRKDQKRRWNTDDGPTSETSSPYSSNDDLMSSNNEFRIRKSLLHGMVKPRSHYLTKPVTISHKLRPNKSKERIINTPQKVDQIMDDKVVVNTIEHVQIREGVNPPQGSPTTSRKIQDMIMTRGRTEGRERPSSVIGVPQTVGQISIKKGKSVIQKRTHKRSRRTIEGLTPETPFCVMTNHLSCNAMKDSSAVRSRKNYSQESSHHATWQDKESPCNDKIDTLGTGKSRKESMTSGDFSIVSDQDSDTTSSVKEQVTNQMSRIRTSQERDKLRKSWLEQAAVGA
jgi:hypothetical protein